MQGMGQGRGGSCARMWFQRRPVVTSSVLVTRAYPTLRQGAGLSCHLAVLAMARGDWEAGPAGRKAAGCCRAPGKSREGGRCEASSAPSGVGCWGGGFQPQPKNHFSEATRNLGSGSESSESDRSGEKGYLHNR